MDDLISRQAALGSVNSWRAEYPLNRQEPLDDCENSIRELPAVEAIPVSWIEAKIELVNSLPGVSMLKMKTADWRDLVEQWKAEQRSPEIDHDAQIREFAEEMSKHGIT